MLAQPIGISLDFEGKKMFIADYANQRIRSVAIDLPNTVITTIAGNGDNAFNCGSMPTPATQCGLNFPWSVAATSCPAGGVWVADTNNSRVRLLTKQSNENYAMSTLEINSSEKEFYQPCGLITDSSGNLYVAESGKHQIFKLICGNFSMLPTVAGTGQNGFVKCNPSDPIQNGQPGPAISSRLWNPVGMAMDGQHLYIADTYNHRIRMIDFSASTPLISVVAGPPWLQLPEECGDPGGTGLGAAGFSGDGGRPTNMDVRLFYPLGVAIEPTSKDIYITDTSNHRIRKVSNDKITTVIGKGSSAVEPSRALEARFRFPAGVAVDSRGNMFILDHANYRVVKVAAGVATIFAGTGVYGEPLDGDIATNARIGPTLAGIAIDSEGSLYFTDDLKYIRKVYDDHGVRRIKTVVGYNMGTTPAIVGALATKVSLDKLRGIAIDRLDNLYIADSLNHRILKVTTSGVLSVVPINNGTLKEPYALAWHNGNLYIADAGNHQVRKLHPNGNIELVAGTGTQGLLADTDEGKPATSVNLKYPHALAVSRSGEVFIGLGNYICVVDLDNKIHRVAGNPNSSGLSGDGGLAKDAQLWDVQSLAIDNDGNVLLADTENNVIRVLKK